MKENEIRPKKLLEKYIKLSSQDAKEYFNDDVREDINCVACGIDDNAFAFEKYNFKYALCNSCGTLFLNPRPSIKSFELFYQNSKSSKYWAETFFPNVAEIRREKIFLPRAESLTSLCEDINLKVNKIIDVGAGYGIFLDEWKKINPQSETIAVEPMSSLAAECRKKGIKVIEAIAEKVTDLTNPADIVVCFEVLEHIHKPIEFINVLKKMVKPGGYVFISTLCIDGFDLQILWDKSTQISPPHHINFLSIEGFKILFERAGLTNVTIKTPGKLDVDIVKKYLNSNLDENHRFIKALVKKNNFQNFLSENQMSSHAWVIGKKT